MNRFLEALGFALKAIGKYIMVVVLMAVMCVSLILLVGSYFMKDVLSYRDNVLVAAKVEDYKYEPNLITQIYSKQGTMLGEVFDENRRYVEYDQIPKTAVDGLVATEDRRFLDHLGIDPYGVARAFAKNSQEGAMVQGASTLTQQITREFFLSQEKRVDRKINEIFLSIQMEQVYDKSSIAEMYLNEVYFGHQAFGIESAAQTYFGKSVRNLNEAELTLLVGLPQAPSAYDPYIAPQKAKNRRLAVLDSMYAEQMLPLEKVKKIAKEPIRLANKKQGLKVTKTKYPHFTYWVINQLKKEYGEKIYSSGWKIYTTLDDNAQRIAQQVASEKASQYGAYYGLKDSVLTAVNPQTGEIMAMANGRSFEKNQYNMAAKPRQPGSTIKPFVYATGIESGEIVDSSVEVDAPVDFDGYKPKNYTLSYGGPTTIRKALMVSNNIVAVKTANKVGIPEIKHTMEQMGITTLSDQDSTLSFALGGLTSGVKPVEAASAYGTFANRGVHVKSEYISKILDRNGKIVAKPEREKERILSSSTADMMNSMLQDVVKKGTGVRARIDRPAAGKTGTTNDQKDLWFMGYVPNLSVAAWVGNVDNKSPYRAIESDVTAGVMWKEFMMRYSSYLPKKNFEKANYKTNAYRVAMVGDEMFLAGEYCKSNGTTNDGKKYTVKSVTLQPSFAPKETLDCSPETDSDYVDNALKTGVELSALVEEGYLKELLAKGFLKELVDLGFFKEIAEAGYVEELEKAGFKEKLIEAGYLPPDEPKEETADTTPDETDQATTEPSVPTPTEEPVVTKPDPVTEEPAEPSIPKPTPEPNVPPVEEEPTPEPTKPTPEPTKPPTETKPPKDEATPPKDNGSTGASPSTTETP